MEQGGRGVQQHELRRTSLREEENSHLCEKTPGIAGEKASLAKREKKQIATRSLGKREATVGVKSGQHIPEKKKRTVLNAAN